MLCEVKGRVRKHVRSRYASVLQREKGLKGGVAGKRGGLGRFEHGGWYSVVVVWERQRNEPKENKKAREKKEKRKEKETNNERVEDQLLG